MENYFGRIDLLEGYSILSLIKIDFDNSYPSTDKILDEWVGKWKDKIKTPIIAFYKDNSIKVIVNKEERTYTFLNVRVDVIEATALLINLARPNEYINVERMLANIFSNKEIIKE